jgi:hypothetical protein
MCFVASGDILVSNSILHFINCNEHLTSRESGRREKVKDKTIRENLKRFDGVNNVLLLYSEKAFPSVVDRPKAKNMLSLCTALCVRDIYSMPSRKCNNARTHSPIIYT